ncbi:TPA: hypothetical protein DCL28_02440 [Candidatus Komeilibacteria bacterium]|nr:MAG: Chromosome partition protein Smc [Parcubacteria group bacterium GW2011_GWC2_45_15]OGY92458.1 MAG: hypothetical protein A2260_04270 [Candidatus Komeilibacteria bacterium RIFOXYA2_FULL_45_9]OGY94780.1 MAG: hypothetical protein A3J95_01340 [Candidatus Komeilibacteria bacterium RIFOXYC2_FULL_45_12]HAH04393.1 hypothetical protein [Candidatus Komeilibacteria bacterium]
MYLQKLEIQGFKSFAEKAFLEFNHDLTAIVGPNGSGKSNVSDSVRWVLGEQSLKLLRGKKAEDVIFAGSHKKSRLGYAEVSLILNNEDGQAPIDYREVVITRRIFRSGESEYLINKNKVRLTDIQLLLAKSNFGQKTYSIIGQGMIDGILTSSPAERKEFFDEATGVKQFQIKKDQAINKLERSQNNLNQSRQVLEEIEPRLKSLTRQVKKLEKKEEILKTLSELQLRYYSCLLNGLNAEETKYSAELNGLASHKQNLENDQRQLQQAIEQRQIQDTIGQAFQKLQAEYSKANAQKNDLLKELTVIQGKIDLDLTKNGKTDLVWAQNKKTEILNNLKDLQNQIINNKNLIGRLNNQLTEKTVTQQGILDDYRRLQQDLLEAQKKLSQNEIFTFGKISSHLNDLYQKQEQFLATLEKITELGQLAELKHQAQAIAQEIKWLTHKLSENGSSDSSALIKIQEKLNQFLTSKDSLVNEIQELKTAWETAKQKNHFLEEQSDKYALELKKIETEISQSQSSGSEIKKELLKQKQNLENSLAKLNENLGVLQTQLDDFSQDQENSRQEIFKLQKKLRDSQAKLNSLNYDYNDCKINLAKIETKKEELEKEIAAEIKNDFQPLAELLKLDLTEALAEINRLKNQLAVIGGIDQEVLAEYQEVKKRYDFLNEQVTDMEQAIKSCHAIIEDLDDKIKNQFEEAFEKINREFEHFFKILFNGGQAKLILKKIPAPEAAETPAADNGDEKTETVTAGKKADEQTDDRARQENKYEYGIDIQATPPGKKLKSLNVLSGGEKALTSIALISAIIANNPSPFVILDEVDAALDEANSQRFAEIVQELSDKTQFICITHNRATMERAAILYGVTMGNDGVSKLLSLNLAEAEKVAE